MQRGPDLAMARDRRFESTFLQQRVSCESKPRTLAENYSCYTPSRSTGRPQDFAFQENPRLIRFSMIGSPRAFLIRPFPFADCRKRKRFQKRWRVSRNGWSRGTLRQRTRRVRCHRFGSRSGRIEFAILTGDQIIGKRETWHSLEAPGPSFEIRPLGDFESAL